jgi:hypothetical protein
MDRALGTGSYDSVFPRHLILHPSIPSNDLNSCVLGRTWTLGRYQAYGIAKVWAGKAQLPPLDQTEDGETKPPSMEWFGEGVYQLASRSSSFVRSYPSRRYIPTLYYMAQRRLIEVWRTLRRASSDRVRSLRFVQHSRATDALSSGTWRL